MTPLDVAAALLFLLGAAHSVLGERYLLVRLFRRADLPRLFGGTAFTTRTLRFAWHLTTVLAWGMAVLLLQLGHGDGDPRRLAATIAIVCFAAALLPLVVTRGRHLSWVVLVAAGALAWHGAMRCRHPWGAGQAMSQAPSAAIAGSACTRKMRLFTDHAP